MSSENYHLYSCEILLYIAWACLRNDLITCWIIVSGSVYQKLPVHVFKIRYFEKHI